VQIALSLKFFNENLGLTKGVEISLGHALSVVVDLVTENTWLRRIHQRGVAFFSKNIFKLGRIVAEGRILSCFCLLIAEHRHQEASLSLPGVVGA
jgi:hypothetical protein